MPCHMTYKRILEVIDAHVLDDLLAAFLTRWEAEQRCGTEPSRLQTPSACLEHAHVAIDGKAVRATSKESQPVHQLSAYDVTTGVVLFQVNVKEKQNEISALKPLLTPAFITNRIFTLDAMPCQRRYSNRTVCERELLQWVIRPGCQRQSTHTCPGSERFFRRTTLRLAL